MGYFLGVMKRGTQIYRSFCCFLAWSCKDVPDNLCAGWCCENMPHQAVSGAESLRLTLLGQPLPAADSAPGEGGGSQPLNIFGPKKKKREQEGGQ